VQFWDCKGNEVHAIERGEVEEIVKIGELLGQVQPGEETATSGEDADGS
jgi:hypothetical protein